MISKIISFIKIAGVFFSIIFTHSAIAQRNKHHINYDSLKFVLERMYDEDQDIRKSITDSSDVSSSNGILIYINQMRVIDERNRMKIASILEKYGWLPKSKIGEKASEAIFFVTQHTELSFAERYFDQFKKLSLKGEANPMQCAMMEDRILMWKGKKQIYGTQSSNKVRSDGKNAMWPIEDPINVNYLRKMVGFKLTVEDNAKILKADYNPHEKLPSQR